MLTRLFLLVIVVALSPLHAECQQKKPHSKQATCSREQAFEKQTLITLGTWPEEQLTHRYFDEAGNFIPPKTESENDPIARRLEAADLQLATEMAAVSPILAQGDYARACQEYDRIANRHGLNFNELRKKLRIKGLEAAQAHPTTEKCSAEQAAERASQLATLLRQTTDSRLKSIEPAFQSFYFANMTDMLVNPGVFCAKLRAFRAAHGL